MDPEKFVYEVRVPKDRVAVIIGRKGEVKRNLQTHMHVTMTIDSQEGLVTLEGKDSLSLYTAREVIKAIARGFNPEVAQLLFRQDYVLELIELADYANTKDSILRLKGRVIGVDGKGRKHIEEYTECFVSVYGKTICVIGELQHAQVARRAIEKLLQGSMHSTVWKFLEKMKRKLKMDEMLGLSEKRAEF